MNYLFWILLKELMEMHKVLAKYLFAAIYVMFTYEELLIKENKLNYLVHKGSRKRNQHIQELEKSATVSLTM
nr:unnamed protein product [Callosobruchus chinensis]